jgi:hypothetical protein
VKLFNPQKLENLGIEKFEDFAKICTAAKHPNLVSVIGICSLEKPMMVMGMEMKRGRESEILKRRGCQMSKKH